MKIKFLKKTKYTTNGLNSGLQEAQEGDIVDGLPEKLCMSLVQGQLAELIVDAKITKKPKEVDVVEDLEIETKENPKKPKVIKKKK